MSLEIEYESLYQRNEIESLQSIITKYVRYNIKSKYPEKLVISISDKHAKIFILYTAECEYQLEFRAKYKDKPLDVATIYHPIQVKNLRKLKNLRKMDINSTKMIN